MPAKRKPKSKDTLYRNSTPERRIIYNYRMKHYMRRWRAGCRAEREAQAAGAVS